MLVACITSGCAISPSGPLGSTTEAGTAEPVAEQQAQAKTESSVADSPPQQCPSRDFKAFLQAFSESPGLQRQFTKLPLEHGILDPSAISTGEEYTLSSIPTYERIPQFDPKRGGAILDNAAARKREDLLLVVEKPGKREDPEYPYERRDRSDRVARLYLDNTGFHIYFRFSWIEGCWFLRAIHDKST